MSCSLSIENISFTNIGILGGEITVVVPQLYPCTTIQLRFRSEDAIINDWTDFATLNQLSTVFYTPIPANVFYIDARLFQCCPPQVDNTTSPCVGDNCIGSPPLLPDDPPCLSVATSFSEECSDTKDQITNPYIRPTDVGITTPKNNIYIPKKVKLTINQTSCSDIQALICTVRCAEVISPVFDISTPEGECPCNFRPEVNINDLPQLNIGRTPYGASTDVDVLCTYDKLHPNATLWRPSFPSNYTKFILYYKPMYGGLSSPSIDGIVYDIAQINVNTYIKIYTANTATEVRNWLKDHFRFYSLDSNKDIRFAWPFVDLYWTPYDLCVASSFTPEENAVYVNLVPC